jgi:hypothetical protein
VRRESALSSTWSIYVAKALRRNARIEVGAAMKVAPATLRAWRVELDDAEWCGPVCSRLEEAFAAGEIKRQLDTGATIKFAGTLRGLAFFEEVRKEPLHEFGRRYQTDYGRRHHTPLRTP